MKVSIKRIKPYKETKMKTLYGEYELPERQNKDKAGLPFDITDPEDYDDFIILAEIHRTRTLQRKTTEQE